MKDNGQRDRGACIRPFSQERAGAGKLWSSREDKAFVKSNEKENLVYHVRPKINIKGKIKILH